MKKYFFLLFTALIILGFYWISPHHQTEKQPSVQLIYPEVTSIQDMVTLHGSVIDPCRKKLYARGYSKVLEVYVEEGEKVQAGQLLMKLEQLNVPYTEQAAAASVLIELQETLESGDLNAAEMLVQDLISHVSAPDNTSLDEKVYCLYSPCNGIVVKCSASKNSEQSTLLPCIEISDPDQLQIEVAAGEDVVSLIQSGLNCYIQIPAFELEDLPGKVLKVAPYAQNTSLLSGNSTVETSVLIRPEENREVLRSGYRVSAKIITAQRENVVLLPYEAILQDETGAEYVLKLINGSIHRQEIQCGAELQTQVEICTGVLFGDLIIVNPQDSWIGEEVILAGS